MTRVLRLGMIALVAGLFLSVEHPAAAAAAGASPPAEASSAADPEGSPEIATVSLDGHALFRVAGISTRTPAVRARSISKRIADAADDPSITTDSLRIEANEFGLQIEAGPRVLLIVTEADGRIEHASRSAIAQLDLIRIREAMIDYRRDRTPRRLLASAAWAAAATVLLVAAVLLLGRTRRRVRTGLERRLLSRGKGVQIQSVELFRSEYLVSAVAWAVGLVYAALLVVVAVVYAQFVLGQFPWTRAVANGLLRELTGPPLALGAAFVAYLPNLLFLAVLVLVTMLVIKILRLLAAGLAEGALVIGGFDSDWAWPTYRIVRALVCFFAVVVAYPYLPGSDSLAFKGVSLFFGVLISLGSTSMVGNLVAGYTMIYRRAFKVGDVVRIGDVLGVVEQVRVLVTHLRTPKNEEIVLPNSLVVGGTVMNYSTIARKDGLILHTTVGIGYETPWRQVEAMLLLAAGRTPGLVREPRPFVHQRALGDFAITYELNVFTDVPRRMIPLYSALHRNILDVFNEYGVQIMTPAYRDDPEQAKVVPKEQWHAAPAAPPEPPARVTPSTA